MWQEHEAKKGIPRRPKKKGRGTAEDTKVVIHIMAR